MSILGRIFLALGVALAAVSGAQAQQSRGTIKIMIVGDSHLVGVPGSSLDRALRELIGAESEYVIMGAGGSSPFSWTSEFNPKKKPGVPTKDPKWFSFWGNWGEAIDSFQKLDFLTWADLAGPQLPPLERPDVVVVSFGSNMAKYFQVNGPDDIVGATNEIDFMISVLDAAQVRWAWVGAPQVREPESVKIYDLAASQVNEFHQFLSARLYKHPIPGFLGYMDAREFVADGPDGLHFKACNTHVPCPGREWGKTMAATIKTWLAKIF